MSSRLGRALRGVSFVCLWLVALPAFAQIRNEGTIPDGRGGVGVLAIGIDHTCALRQDGTASCWGNDYNGKTKPPAGTFIELSAGFEHTCGLRGDGSVTCWGYGYGAVEGEPPPPAPPSMSGRFTALASGMSQTCGLRVRAEPWQYPEGNVACWAADGWGMPVPPPPAGDFAALSLGDTFACGLRADGRAECWGGIDATAVPGDAFIALSAGMRHACGLRADGVVQCWGENWANQATPPAELFTAISAGGSHTCGLRTDNSVQCWGDNGANQNAPSPGERFVAISAGMHHSCGVRMDGQVACWGQVNWGIHYGPPPLPYEGIFGVGQLAAGNWHQCQVNPEGRLSCWGGFEPDPAPWTRFSAVASGENFSCARNEVGLLDCFGNGFVQEAPPPEPLREFDLGYEHGCAVHALDGRAQCWGRETNGKTLAPEGLFRQISAGFMHSCGVTADGIGTCWGYDGDGQSTLPGSLPDPHFLTVQAGERHSCGIDGELHIKCWGLSPPLPYDPYNSEPQYHPDFATFRALSVGAHHTCAIRTDGRLLCWGENWMGQLQAPEGTFVAVSAGRGHTCAIRTDGSRECWGEPYMKPILRLAPERLPGARPGQWFEVRFDLHAEQPYQLFDPRYAIVAGTLPLGIRLDPDGALRGSWHEAGRFPITVEGRDRNGFAVRRDYVLAIDDTPPVIEPVFTGSAGDNGWYTSEVNLAWSVTDAESDILWSTGCDPVTLSHDTPDAGFFCHAESAGGPTMQEARVKIDLRAPVTHLVDAKFEGAAATFVFEGDDGLSGLAGFECSVDGAAFAACASPYTVTVETGSHEFQVRAVDAAGNRDPFGFRMPWMADATPPVIDAHIFGTQGLDGWYTSDVEIHLNAHDPDSPIGTMAGCGPMTLGTDSIGASFTCTATSNGGTATRTVTVRRDATAPVIVASATTAPNDAGWYNQDVTVAYACSDATSGVVDCFDRAELLSGEGVVTAPSHHARDAAGNFAVSNEVAVRIDRTAPTLAPTVGPGTLLLNAVAAASANGSDALSGIASQQCDALATATVGSKSVACTVTDAAGNSAGGSTGYRVIYGFSGFDAPVQNPSVLNVLKVNRSVPFRWRVVDAQGAPVSNLSTASVNGIAMACPSATESRIGTYGGTNGQLQNLGNGYYQLDWMAGSSLRGTCGRLEIGLDDGEIHPALFKFN